MSEQTNIEWADSTFNPWIGCTKVGPGCDHCYAASMDARKVFQGVTHWGTGVPRQRTTESNWNQVLRWNDKADEFFAQHGRRRRVFCASLADVFDNEVPNQWRQDLFDLILASPNLDWLLVTKRIGIAKRMLDSIACTRGALLTASDLYKPPANVWLGITVVNQAEADRDIPKLLAIPASVRFLSMEPLLGPVDLRLMEYQESRERTNSGVVLTTRRNALDWVIVGGESGDEARPMHPDWVRDLRDQCHAAGVPFLFKQWGEWVDGNNVPKEAENRIWFDKKRSSFDMYDLGLLKDMVPPKPPGAPYFACSYYIKVGKKAAGRLLDGKTHTEFPEVA